MTRWLGLAAALVAANPAIAAAPDAPHAVEIDAATARRLTIQTAPVKPGAQAQTVTGFARVLDPIPLAQLDSDIAAAAATASASQAEAARSRALFAADATLSRKAAEAASAQARGDAARLALLRRRLGLEWGPAISGMSATQRSALVTALANGRAALVRIDSASGIGQAGLRSATLDLGATGSVEATILGPARAADPRLQSPGLIARVSGSQAGVLSSGLAASAKMRSAAQSGFLIPASAVLHLAGGTWVFVQTRPGSFIRRHLVEPSAVPGGLFVRAGVRPGELMVVQGAAALYAAERGGGPAED